MIRSGDLARRFYRMRLSTGALLALPLALTLVWYAWSAFAELDRYRRAVKEPPPVDRELFQLYLHDELRRDLRRMFLPERPSDGKLPTFELSLTRTNLDALNQRQVKEGADAYVPALLRKDGVVHHAKVRYRGGQHWHWLKPQKSLKVRLDEGDLLDGARVFNLLNDPSPFGLEDEIVLDLAREGGILTAEYQPAWVRLNNTDLGVFRYEAQPDEGLLRRSRRMPGSLFSGDAEEGGADERLGLFGTPSAWRLAASRADGTHEARHLQRLLDAVANGTHQQFATFARDHLDLDRYALFDALDVVFGGNEHDYLSNHRLYLDPYRGRFEPVAWSFRGFQNDAPFNAVDNPLLIRLKLSPGYLALRDRKVYELLTGAASVPAVRSRVDQALARLAPDLAADPYWDGYKLLPRATRFHRFLVRPMSTDRWMRAARLEMKTYASRARALLEALETPRVEARYGPSPTGPGRLTLTVAGHGAWRLAAVSPKGTCAADWDAFADADLDGRLDRSKDPRVGGSGDALVRSPFTQLYPSQRLVPRADPSPKRGALRVEPAPQAFVYFVGAGRCSPAQLDVVLESLVTGERLPLAASPSPPDAPSPGPSPQQPPQLRSGEEAPHPWRFAQPPPEEHIRLGPGRVQLDVSRTYLPHQTVEVSPGTAVALGPGVSLVFEGRVTAEGTRDAPIQIVRAEPGQPFGQVVVRGPSAAGSRLTWVTIAGGRSDPGGFVSVPGLLNLHDTRAVTLSNVSLRGEGELEDVLHAAYVSDLQLFEVTVEDAARDGVDLELTSGEVRGLRVLGAADDCLDLMGVTLRVQDSLLLACHNNALSAGEESDVTAHRLVVVDSRTGVLSKNGSQVRLLDGLLYRAATALKTKGRERYYPGRSVLRGESLHVVSCERREDRAGQTTLEVANVRAGFPVAGQADRLLRRVVGVDRWSDLEARLAQARVGAP